MRLKIDLQYRLNSTGARQMCNNITHIDMLLLNFQLLKEIHQTFSSDKRILQKA